MSDYTHETVPTQFVEAEGIRYAYRRLGKTGTVPLLFLEYFNSNMDGWDPAVTNTLAADHEVILFDNAGVGASGGETPYTAVEMTPHCVAFCRALGLKAIHIVGFSLGGMIAQQLALDPSSPRPAPDFVGDSAPRWTRPDIHRTIARRTSGSGCVLVGGIFLSLRSKPSGWQGVHEAARVSQGGS
jgi:pimeloyl-ACP methyl ester carboxylesterase